MALQGETLDPVEMAMYVDWGRTYDMMLPVDLSRATVLYLKTSLGACMARLAARAREGEVAAPDKKGDGAAGGVSIEYQARLRRAHEAFFQGLHPEEFPHLPASPFHPGSVIEVPPELADGNFRDPGPERDRIAVRIADLLLGAGPAASSEPPQA